MVAQGRALLASVSVLLFLVGCGGPPAAAPSPAPVDTNDIGPSPATEEPGVSDENSDESDTPSESQDDAPPPTPEEVTTHVLSSCWEIVGYDVIASAFAVTPTRLATNAHVVSALARPWDGTTPPGVVVQHETGVVLPITQMWVHPDYNGSSTSSPDVGVVEVDGELTATLALAEMSTLANLAVFDEVRMCGFPGDVTLVIDLEQLIAGESFYPRATCLSGTISGLRPFVSSESATPSNTQLIQHDLATTEGTSGSPIYVYDGSVIAINAAATTDEAGLNRFAPRIDTLEQLLDWIDNGQVGPVVAYECVTDGDCGPGYVCESNECVTAPGCVSDADCNAGEICVNQECVNAPDMSGYPLPILEPAPGCDLICVQYLPGGDVFCDSDCDGWYDSVEVTFGSDRCSALSPPYSPDTPALICSEIWSYLRISPDAADALAEEATRAQRDQLARDAMSR